MKIEKMIDFIKTFIKKIISMMKKEQISENSKYTDLAPIDKIENGDEYIDALNWALQNKKVKNIALSGPYGSGKSSIIETYLNINKDVDKKTLRISMATFVENIVGNDESKTIDFDQSEIELGILKQLFYKVSYRKTPQSRYRKIHKVSGFRVFSCFSLITFLCFFFMFIFSNKTFKNIISKIVKAGLSINLTSKISLFIFIVIILIIIIILTHIYRSTLSRFKLKEIKLPLDGTVNSNEESSDSIFNKYMDEIMYFFEETKYKYVFFEDLDRLNNSKVFVHLRELNTLLNNSDTIKNKIIFVYAIKDDVFSNSDRTKFFDFIIPVIPIINSTNSGDILLEKLKNSKDIGMNYDISEGFVLDISPYIYDMRTLLNIYNEFVIYKKTLFDSQGLEKLSDENMMALIIFKNLYPYDFADIQMEKGIIKEAFKRKNEFLEEKKSCMKTEISRLEKLIDDVENEVLNDIMELRSSFLFEITKWKGFPSYIDFYGQSSITVNDVMNPSFDFSKFENITRVRGAYFVSWQRQSDFNCDTFNELYKKFLKREKLVNLKKENNLEKIKLKIKNLKTDITNLSSLTMKFVLEKYEISDIFSDSTEVIRKNKLLMFLLRRGYIDEQYSNYINYFKGNSVTKSDMEFILSVKNMDCQSFNYKLTKKHIIVKQLQEYEFRQKSIYNFDLLEYMLFSYNSNNECQKLKIFMRQLSDEDDKSWDFIEKFITKTEFKGLFIKLLVSEWKGIWKYILDDSTLTYEDQINYLILLIDNLKVETLLSININNSLGNFFINNKDILQKLSSIDDEKLIEIIGRIGLKFQNILIENVSSDILNYIFDCSVYVLNKTMINNIVRSKNSVLFLDLEVKPYTTLKKLDYGPLTIYVNDELEYYLEDIVFVDESIFEDDVEDILYLIEYFIENKDLCNKIILHENFILDDISLCCKEFLTEKRFLVKNIWDTLLENNKVYSTWENVICYYDSFGLSNTLINYMEINICNLKSEVTSSVTDNFINSLIISDIDNEIFEELLPKIRISSFNVDLNSIKKEKLSIMIKCHYFDFSVDLYIKIKELYPILSIDFILFNQDKYLNNIDHIDMDTELFESLILSDKLEVDTLFKLLSYFNKTYMTNEIANILSERDIKLDLNLFKLIWGSLDQNLKESFMLKNLKILNSSDFHFCFDDLKGKYSKFIDRSKRIYVDIENSDENLILAERLKEVEYITSYRFDMSDLSESSVIKCKIKKVE